MARDLAAKRQRTDAGPELESDAAAHLKVPSTLEAFPCFLQLPAAAIAAVARHLPENEKLMLGRQVLAKATPLTASPGTDPASGTDTAVAAQEAAATAAFAVLSTVQCIQVNINQIPLKRLCSILSDLKGLQHVSCSLSLSTGIGKQNPVLEGSPGQACNVNQGLTLASSLSGHIGADSSMICEAESPFPWLAN